MPGEEIPSERPRRRRALPASLIAVVAGVAVILVVLGVWLAVGMSDEDSTADEQVDVPAEGTASEYAALEKQLTAVLEDDPDDLNTRRVLASVLAKQGKYEEAIREYQRVIDGDVTDHESLYAIAILERQIGLTDEALKHLQSATDIAGEVAYLDDLARTSMQVGKYEDAIAAWKRVLEDENLEPQRRAETLGALASAYQDAKMYEEAKAALQEAVALMPDDENLKARLEAMGN